MPPIQGMWNTALFCQSIFLKVYDWNLVRKYTIICSALLVWKVTCNKDVLQVAVQPPYKGLYFQLTGKGFRERDKDIYLCQNIWYLRAAIETLPFLSRVKAGTLISSFLSIKFSFLKQIFRNGTGIPVYVGKALSFEIRD